jgi:hypothetical protein
MGVDTRGLVQTQCKDVFLISSLAEGALNQLISTEKKLRYPRVRGFTSEVHEQFTLANCRLIPRSGMVQFSFKFCGETRTLSMFFDCDSDDQEFGDKKISVSMGCHGDSDIFVQTVLHALSLLGPAHYDRNDCDDIDYAPLNAYRPTLIQAVSLGYACRSNVEDWVQFFKESPDFPDKSDAALEAVIGLPVSDVFDVLRIAEHTERWERLDALVMECAAPEVPFMAEFHEQMAHLSAVG